MTTTTVKQSTQPTVTHEFVRELFRPKGTRYLAPELVADALKMKLPKPPPIRFDEAELTSAEARGEQLVYLPRENAKGAPITADLICTTLGNKAPLGGFVLHGLKEKECWYRDQREEFFFAETVRTSPNRVGAYRINSLHAVPDTKRKQYLSQTIVAARYVETEIYHGALPASLKQIVPEPVERETELSQLTNQNWVKGAEVQATLPFNQFARGNFVEMLIWVVVNQYVNRFRFLEKDWAWLVSRSRYGGLVCFGDAGEDGAYLRDWNPRVAGDHMGFFLSRSEEEGRES